MAVPTKGIKLSLLSLFSAPVSIVYIMSNTQMKIKAVVDKPMQLTCLADGSPPPEFIWESMGPTESEFRPLSIGSDQQNQTITPDTKDNGRKFRCKAYNSLNTNLIDSNTVTLVVEGKFVITQSLKLGFFFLHFYTHYLSLTIAFEIDILLTIIGL